MALAESTHDAALRGQKKARAGGGVRDAVHGEVPEALLPQELGTQHFTLDDDDSVPELGGSWPDRLHEVRPQERVQQHPADEIVDTARALPILDVPVPLMGEQLVDVLRFFDTLCPAAEQVIDVPKITLEDIPATVEDHPCATLVSREPQLVEQLVDEPVPSFDDFDLVDEEEEEEEQLRMVPGSRVRDAHGRSWCRVARTAGVYWWMIGTCTAQYTLRGGDHRQARTVYRYWPFVPQGSSSSTEWWGSAVAVGSRIALFDSGYIFCVSKGGSWKNFWFSA